MPDATNRRRFLRIPCDAGVKVYDARARRYRAGRVVNHSPAGALIELLSPMHSTVGDSVRIAIDTDGHTPLVPYEAMRSATIVRRAGHHLAVQFAAAVPQCRAA